MVPSQEWNGQRSDRSSPEDEEEEEIKWTDPEVSTKESTNLSTNVFTNVSTKESTNLSTKMTSWAEVSTKTDEIEEEIVVC